jgi:hypothetical protein
LAFWNKWELNKCENFFHRSLIIAKIRIQSTLEITVSKGPSF